MAKKLYEENNMSALAQKIRSKAGNSKVYKVSEMPSGIDEVYQNGYNIGQTSGYTEGHDAGYVEGHNAGYAKGLEDGKEQGGSVGGTETGTDVSTIFGVHCGEKWYCPPNGENAISFNMMVADMTGRFAAFGNMAASPGKKYRAIFKPMNPDNLWENFVFGHSDYSSLCVVANDESIGQYVTKVSDDTFEFVVPPNCSLVFLNGYIQFGCRVYELE